MAVDSIPKSLGLLGAFAAVYGPLLLLWWFTKRRQNQFSRLEDDQESIELPGILEIMADDVARDVARETVQSVGFHSLIDARSFHDKNAFYSEIFVTRLDGGVQTLERVLLNERPGVEARERAQALAARLSVDFFEI